MNRLAIALSLMLAAPLCAEEPRRDRFGDPLPPGAVARLGTIHAHPHVECITFSADGTTLITTGRHCVRHWDTATGRVTKLNACPAPSDAEQQIVAPDGRTRAILWRDHLEVRDIASDRVTHRRALPPYQYATPFVFSPRGDLVLVSLRLESERPGAATFVMRTDSGKVSRWDGVEFDSALWSRDGHRVGGVVSRRGNRVLECRDATGKLLFERPGARPLAFSPDGTTLLIHHDGLRLVDAASGVSRGAEFPKPMTTEPWAEFSPDGRLVALDAGEGVTLWDPKAGKAVHTWDGWAKCFAFSPDGKRLAAGTDLIRGWSVETGKPLWPDFGPLIGNATWPDYVCFLGRDAVGGSPATQPPGMVVTARNWSRVQVWDANKGTPLAASGPLLGPHYRVAWVTADGSHLYTCMGTYVQIWDTSSGRELRRLDPRPSKNDEILEGIDSARVLRDGRTLVMLMSRTRVENGEHLRPELVRWDIGTWRLLERRLIDTGLSELARVTADGRHVADRDFMLNVATGRRQTVAVTPTGYALVATPELSADGRLAVGHNKREGEDDPCEWVVWETATGTSLLRGPTGSQWVIQTALSPDNRWLAVAAEQKIELWDLATGRRAAEIRHATPDVPRDPARYCVGLMLLPDRKLIAAYADRTALVWAMPAETEKPPPQKINERTWDDLAAAEPRRAQTAVWALASDPAKAVALLREKLRPSAAIPAADLAALVADLGSADFPERDAAFRRLHELGHQVEKPLVEALAKAANAEQSKRLKMLLDACHDDGPHSADERRAVRAVQALGLIASADARALLEAWAKGTETAMLTVEAKRALNR